MLYVSNYHIQNNHMWVCTDLLFCQTVCLCKYQSFHLPAWDWFDYYNFNQLMFIYNCSLVELSVITTNIVCFAVTV